MPAPSPTMPRVGYRYRARVLVADHRHPWLSQRGLDIARRMRRVLLLGDAGDAFDELYVDTGEAG